MCPFSARILRRRRLVCKRKGCVRSAHKIKYGQRHSKARILINVVAVQYPTGLKDRVYCSTASGFLEAPANASLVLLARFVIVVSNSSTPRTDHDLDHRYPFRDLDLSRQIYSRSCIV